MSSVSSHAKTAFVFSDVNNIMLCGIESHVCVQCTVFDLKEKGFNVHVIVDANSSRSMVDR